MRGGTLLSVLLLAQSALSLSLQFALYYATPKVTFIFFLVIHAHACANTHRCKETYKIDTKMFMGETNKTYFMKLYFY